MYLLAAVAHQSPAAKLRVACAPATRASSLPSSLPRRVQVALGLRGLEALAACLLASDAGLRRLVTLIRLPTPWQPPSLAHITRITLITLIRATTLP